MKIAQLMAGTPHGGAERFFERHGAALARRGHEVLAVIRPEPAREQRLRAAGLLVATAHYGGALDLLTRARLRRLLTDFAPRVAIAWMGRAAAHAPRGPWHLAGRLGGYYDLRRFIRCDTLIGNTEGIVRHMIEAGAAADRVIHLPNFADDLAGAPPAALGLPDGHARLLALGRLHRNKGFDTLLAALAAVPEASLALIGDGPERARLQAQAARLGLGNRLAMPGWRDDVASLLAAADALIVPSRSEVLGNVVIEGFAAGRPVIAARAAGPAELIDDGATGLLTPIDDVQALAHAMQRLIADPALAGRLAAAGRARFEQSHAEGPVMARWEAFLRTVA